MDFLNKVGEKVGDMTSAMTSKVNEIVPSVEKSELKSEEKNLENLYCQLGRHIYDNYKDSIPFECTNILEQIEAGKNRLHIIRQKVNANTSYAPGEILCQNCGKPVPDGKKFCTNCGTKVVVPLQKVAPVVDLEDTIDLPPIDISSVETASKPAPIAHLHRFCEECGQELEADALFCMSCGHKVQ